MLSGDRLVHLEVQNNLNSWWCWCIAAQASVLTCRCVLLASRHKTHHVFNFIPKDVHRSSSSLVPDIATCHPEHWTGAIHGWSLEEPSSPLLSIHCLYYCLAPCIRACSFPLSSASSPSPIAPSSCRRPQLQRVDWGLQMSFWGRFSCNVRWESRSAGWAFVVRWTEVTHECISRKTTSEWTRRYPSPPTNTASTDWLEYQFLNKFLHKQQSLY